MNNVLLDGEPVSPSKIICIGRNYGDHIKELGNEIPSEMVVFVKPNSAISDNLLSFHQEALHYEGEICFLVKDNQFASVGFGLDLTKRELQGHLKSRGLPWERAKAFNGSAVFSPFVKLSNIQPSLSIELKINDSLIQSGSISEMLYQPDQILRELQSFMHLYDGDIVMTGTPKGVGIIQQGDHFCGRIKDDGHTITQGQWEAL